MQDSDGGSRGAWLPVGRVHGGHEHSSKPHSCLQSLVHTLRKMDWSEAGSFQTSSPRNFFCQIDELDRCGKFQPVAYKGVMVNYNTSRNAYRVWDRVRQMVYNVGTPTCDETAQPGWWRVSPRPRAIDAAKDDVIFIDLPTAPVPALEVSDAASTVEQEATASKEVQPSSPDPTSS